MSPRHRALHRCAGLLLAVLAATCVAQGTPAEPAQGVPQVPQPKAAAADPAAMARKPADRPKIGLVLSGGGARGAAHIGVLKVLQEIHVPVDLIVGTSMGSIVGASYATGLSLPEMEEAISRIRTATLFTDKPPRADASMRQKSDDFVPYLIPDLGISETGVVLPKGVVTGITLEGELRRLVQVPTARSFDELPIPFRAVATDIGTGEMVVLKEGSVVAAIRASMSVPGAVAPVTIGNRQLVDGGLVRNLPVDVARAMGADIVIAVNLGTPLLRPDQITSVLSVSMQMINILTQQNVDRSLKELNSQDILIEPALGDFSAADFDNLLKTIPIGEAAARKVAERLQALAIPAAEYAALRSRQVARTEMASITVQDIRVEGTARVSPAVVLQAMQTQVGKPLDRDTIDLDMRRIYGRGDFESVNYTVDDVDGRQTLVVIVKEKPQQNYVRFGLELDADLGRQADFNLYASHRMRWLNRWGAEWRNDLVLGTDVLASTELYQPLGESQYFFVAPRAFYSISQWNLFLDDVRIAEYQDTVSAAQLDIGANIIQYGEARVGVLFGNRTFELQSGDMVFPPKAGMRIGAAQASLRLDRLDSVNFAHGGYQAAVHMYSSISALGAEDVYSYWDGHAQAAFSWGANTLEPMLAGGSAIGTDPIPIYDLFSLGGFMYLSGTQRQQLKAEEYVFARLVYRRKLAEIPFFEGVYAGASLEAAYLKPQIATIWQDELRTGRFGVPAGSLFLGVDSPLGPLYLGFGYANRDNKAIYLFVGRP